MFIHRTTRHNTTVNQKVEANFKLRGNREREELVHCAVLTVPVEVFSHLQNSALPSVDWQQRGRKHGRYFARLHHRRTTWRSAVSLGRRSETCGNSPSLMAVLCLATWCNRWCNLAKERPCLHPRCQSAEGRALFCK